MATLKLDIPKPLATSLAAHFGEVSPAAVVAAVDYACRRKQALRKDSKRHAAGKLASRLYAPRLPDNAPKKLAALVEQVREVGEKLATKNGRKA